MSDQYIAVDPSLAGTAVAYGNAANIETRRFSSPPMGATVDRRMQRASALAGNVATWIGRRAQSPRVAFIEGYGFQSRPGQAQLIEYGGMLRVELLAFTRQIVEIPPAALKLFTTGTGRADKCQMAHAVGKLYHARFQTHDETDAAALLRMGLILLGADDPKCDNQRALLTRHRVFVSHLRGFEQWQKRPAKKRPKNNRQKKLSLNQP